MINEICHLSSKVEIMVSICLIAPYKLTAFWLGFGCCLGNFCGFSYFFLLFSGFLGGVWGAVLGISAISATFFLVFFGFLAEFGALFGKFIRFQLLFSALFQLFGWVWGAVLEILGITAPQDPLAMLPTYGYCTL